MDGDAAAVASAFKSAMDYLAGLSRSPNFWALLIAVLSPVAIIVGLQEIRMRRVRHIFDFERTFERIAHSCDGRGPNPSFEFVRSKYIEDVEIEGRLNNPAKPLPTGTDLEELLTSIRQKGRSRDLRLLPTAVTLMIVTFFGVEALMASATCAFQSVSCHCSTVMLVQCPETSPTASNDLLYGNLIVIGGLAFAGAYIGTLRSFMRSLAVFDLSSYTFLRHTVEMIAAVIFTMIAFAAVPDPLNPFLGAMDENRISRLWIALAPMLALMPRSATQFLFTKVKNLIPWFKTEDDRYQGVTRITTIDVIDGVDFATRFRLEECGIYDVQNLAAANPIMLHIESPFGIYQCIDWVAQAQLCHILGIEKFLLMRELNIRTIFDLERAIDSRDGPDEFDTVYAGILFATSDNLRSVAKIGASKPMTSDGVTINPVGVDEYCIWVREVVGLDSQKTTICIEHVMRWIGDDLHVRRLRLVWNDICGSLGPRSESLIDSKERRR